MRHALPLAALFALAACGGQQDAAENAAEMLEDAAEQSNPAAAPMMENGAEQIREHGGNMSDAQNVMQQAGNAQVGLPPAGAPSGTRY